MKQAATAIAVYRDDIEPTLHGRQLFVREQLAHCTEWLHEAPTALELLRYIAAQFPHRSFDPNSVRPRLTEMQTHGWVAHAGKRRCAVSGKTVFTWRTSTPRPPSLSEPITQELPL